MPTAGRIARSGCTLRARCFNARVQKGKQTAAPMNLSITRDDLIANVDRMNLVTEQLERMLSAMAVLNHALTQLVGAVNATSTKS